MPERESWDAIVIGSGLGGLTCAAYLCAIGKRTLVGCGRCITWCPVGIDVTEEIKAIRTQVVP